MYKFCMALVALYYKIFFGARYIGAENIPTEGGLLICVNHLSNNDPVIVAGGVPRQLRFMSKKELFKVPVLSQIIKAFGAYPIDRSISDIGAVKLTLGILKNGDSLMMFPEGRRNKKFVASGIKPGAATIAFKAGVPILPVYIDGQYRLFGKTTVYFGNPVSPEKIGDVLKTAAQSGENKNRIITEFLYDIICGAKKVQEID